MLRGMPLPVPDSDTQPFWDGCQEDRFLLPRCSACATSRWPPGPICPSCQCADTDWVETSGRGSLYSWVVVTHPVDDVLVDQIPYVVGMIELEEGVRVVGNVLGCEPDEVYDGMPVRVVFEEMGGMRLPNFEACPTGH